MYYTSQIVLMGTEIAQAYARQGIIEAAAVKFRAVIAQSGAWFVFGQNCSRHFYRKVILGLRNARALR
jgi:hypothetical protein